MLPHAGVGLGVVHVCNDVRAVKLIGEGVAAVRRRVVIICGSKGVVEVPDTALEL